MTKYETMIRKKSHHVHAIYMAIALVASVILTNTAQAWEGMPTPKLHVNGRYLQDPSGKNVLLHGWMQPTETWFNGGGRWYSNPSDWTNPNNVAGMLNYLKAAATVMSDTSPRYGRDHGWYCSFVRVNTDSIGGWTQASGLVNPAQFDGWINNFLVPYAEHLRSRGLYLVLSATGPINTPNNGTRNAGVIEGQRLITFWQTVANAPGVKNADNIMFELMNEPVEIESSPGNGDWGMGSAKYFAAFRDWIQPVIDTIRNTGADNVIWVPTLEWQGSPQQHAQYPFTGTNCGVAVHYYPAYGGVFDNPTRIQNLWNSQYKPAADRWPMIITEMFWTPFPDDPWNLVNGTTAGFGNAIKNAIDNQGNVSYLVGFLGDLLDHLNDALPANCNLSSREGAQAFFDWLPTYTWAAPSDRPRELSATRVTDAQINLAWTGVPDALSYNIKRSTDSGGPYVTLASDITASRFGDTTITPDTIYYYVVSANMSSGESPNSNEATPIGLRAYLKFDEADGAAAYDSTGNGWVGSLNNGAVWAEGKFANAVDLDGSTGYVSLPTGVVDGLTDVTISAWVYLDSVSTWSRLFDFGNDTMESMYLTPRNSSGVVSFAVSTNDDATLVEDHFDDGNVGTNTTGIGSGFNVWVEQNFNPPTTITEANSRVTLNNPVHGGSRGSITSKEGAAIGSGISRFEFRGVSFAVANNTTTGSTARNTIGVKQGNAAWDYNAGLPTGFWIQFENNSLLTANGNGGWNGTSVLFYEANNNTKTVLATWTFDTLNWNAGTRNFVPVLDITLDVSSDGYALTIEGDTITLMSGSLAGTFAAAGITNELTVGYASAYVQSENPNVNMSIDQISILGDVAEQITGVEELPAGSWTHVAVTLKGDTGVLYVDGEQVGHNNAMSLTPGSLGNTIQNYIGRSQHSDDPYLNGRVDDFRIYTNALNAAEVAALYAEAIPADVPAAPTDLNAVETTGGRIDLIWTASADVTNYNVKRSTVDGGPYTHIAALSGTSFTDTDLSQWTIYYYVVSAVNGAGESIDSMQADVFVQGLPPAAPSGLTADAGDGVIALAWNANAEGGIAGYNVYRSTVPANAYILLNSSLLLSPEFIDDDVINFTTYSYIVTAVDIADRESAYSNPVQAAPTDSRLVPLTTVDFENGFGDWANLTGQGTYDWLRQSGSTPTPVTGPSGGAEGSTWYAYMRTSLGYANAAGNNAILESPVIHGSGRVLAFYYHMYGVHIGTLNVDVYDGTWHEGVWSVSGQQHTTGSQPYAQAFVDLSDFTGPIRIRLRAVAAGGGFGDIAIDEIEVKGRFLYGDMNGDGIVDADDLVEFAGYWLQDNCDLDLDGDCLINLYEFAEFAENWLDDSFQ